jgi:hypothetical protein
VETFNKISLQYEASTFEIIRKELIPLSLVWVLLHKLSTEWRGNFIYLLRTVKLSEVMKCFQKWHTMISLLFLKICRNMFFRIIEGVVSADCTVCSLLIKINELRLWELSFKSD